MWTDPFYTNSYKTIMIPRMRQMSARNDQMWRLMNSIKILKHFYNEDNNLLEGTNTYFVQCTNTVKALYTK